MLTHPWRGHPLLVVLAAVLLGIVHTAKAASPSDEILVVTEVFPPYVMEANGQATGQATDVVLATLKAAGLRGRVELVPWPRALKMVEARPNVLIYPLSRSPARERLFKWIGMVNQSRNMVYARKGKVSPLARLEDGRSLVVGVVRDDVRDGYFARAGYPNIERVAADVLNFRKLMAGRIDLWPMSDAVADYIARSEGVDPKTQLTAVWEIKDLSPYHGGFMAFGAGSDDALVDALKQGLDRVHLSGEWDRIAARWSTHPLISQKPAPAPPH